MPPLETEDLISTSARVFIVGQSEPQRQKLARIADGAGLVVAGVAPHPAEASAQLATFRPALVLIDQPSGLHEAVRWVRELAAHNQKAPVAVFSPYEDAVLAERVLRAGASGYLLKSDPSRTLVEGVRQLLSDGLYVSQSVGLMLVREFLRRGAPNEVMPEQSLSKRELQVLELVGLGLDTRDIASKLYISAKTVEAHRWHIKQKLNLRRAQDLTRYALRRLLEA
jgi:DNA-binding NarL/FixJ family response regulator